MQARQRIHWSQLRVGILSALVLVMIAVSIFFVDDLQLAFEDRYTLQFRTLTTQSIRVGSPVWYAGQPVGHVRRLQFEPPSRATEERLHVILSIRSEVRPHIVEGSTVQIITAGRIGQAVINILPAIRDAAPVPDGGELPVARKLDLGQLVRGLQEVVDSISPMSRAWSDVMTAAREGEGTLARFNRNPGALDAFQARARRTSEVLSDLAAVGSRLSELVKDPLVRTSLARIGDRLPEVEDRLQNGDGSLRAMVEDDGLPERLERIDSRLEQLSERLSSGRGSLGRFLNDPALQNELAETRSAVEGLMRDLRSGSVGAPSR